MTAYRYLNPDHTLVLRDDYVLAWDPRDGKPLDRQPDGHSGELKIWEEAGSPRPEEPPPIKVYQGAAEVTRRLNEQELADVENALDAMNRNDVAGLRKAVRALAQVVRNLAKERPQ